MQILKNINPTVKKVLSVIFSWVIIPILIVLFVQTFMFQAFYVEGSSMEPTLHNDDYVFTSKVGLNLHRLISFMNPNLPLKRGEIIVFKLPTYDGSPLIKRVIGLPGERIVVNGGKVTIYNKEKPNGWTLNETYIDAAYPTEGNIDTKIDPGHVFVMGDNRSPGASLDSRIFGQVEETQIYGKALLRLLPIHTFTTLENASYAP